MKVLIADFDLFSDISREQVFYSSLIQAHPEIDFHYFLKDEGAGLNRPRNAFPIEFSERYCGPRPGSSSLQPARLEALRLASNLAYSARERAFDIVDVPERQPASSFLKAALRHHGVRFEAQALSIHGDIPLQPDSSDLRYTIAKTAFERCDRASHGSVHYLDPLRVLGTPRVASCGSDAGNPPALGFFSNPGLERDIQYFIELVWFLPKHEYAHANLYGKKCDPDDQFLHWMIVRRGLKGTLRSRLAQENLRTLFSRRSLNLAPSCGDEFSLIGLQSLLAGCPTFIGEESDMVRFLAERFPQIPFLRYPSQDPRLATRDVREALLNYDRNRAELTRAIQGADWSPGGADLKSIYGSAKKSSQSQASADREFAEAIASLENGKIARKIRKPESAKRASRLFPVESGGLWMNIRHHAASFLIHVVFGGSELVARQTYYGARLRRRRRDGKAESKDDLLDLLRRYRIDRIRIFQELGALDKAAGKDLAWAAYQIRVMHWLGEDRFKALAPTLAILEKNGFTEDAELLRLMYGEQGSDDARCLQFLQERLERNKAVGPLDYQIFDDRRTRDSFRCAVVVSLYNAAHHLDYFLTDICQQTLVLSQECEIVLVDSGSPGNEHEIFLEFARRHPNVQIVYARSELRETIQSAWNRGASISKADYVTPLGVDEMIRPDALETLAREMDRDPRLDWISGDALVTGVDEAGRWLYDSVLYDRSGYDQDICFLDASYLSYAGALYRRSVHDRIGFFDGGFKAGGDNEFRFRLLPFIRTKTLPETVAAFRDFPEDRVTAHPRAEIEDLRAWYLFRTRAGIQYSFQGRGFEDMRKQLVRCFAFRRAGNLQGQLSCSLDYALNLLSCMEASHPAEFKASRELEKLRALVPEARQIIRELDLLPSHEPLAVAWRVYWSFKKLRTLSRRIQRCLGAGSRAAVQLFNDNRHEQHYYPW